MAKNSSLRNSVSSLSVRPKSSVEPLSEPTSSTSTSNVSPQMPGNKPITTYSDSPNPIGETYRPVTHSSQPARVYFPPPPRFPAELFDIEAQPKCPGVLNAQPGRLHFPPPPTFPTELLDVQAPPKGPDVRNVQPDRLCIPPPPPFPTKLLGPPALSKLQPLPSLGATESLKIPDVLDDGWFEQKLQKLMDMKLELARARLESQGVNVQACPSLMPLDVPEMVEEEKEEASDEHGCFVKPVEEYTKPFCDFLTENPTVFHAVDYFKRKLEANGFLELSERSAWTPELDFGGKYFVERNGSSLIAFTIGENYTGGNGVAMIAGHVDALTARLKPVSTKRTTAGYVQLGVAPYAGGVNATWWDRDLGIGGRVLVKDSKTGRIKSKLVKLGWPIARIPTLAPHFGIGMFGQQNTETQTVPIIGLDNSDIHAANDDENWKNMTLGGAGTFAATQPPKLVRAIAGELQIQDYSTIVNWELELYDIQPAQVGGLDKEFIFAGRIDDKLCSWSAMEALLASNESKSDECIKLVGVFDDEEIGSLLRQGARGNFLPSTIERICEAFCEDPCGPNTISQTYANSFLLSADVTHAVNPNFLGSYLENHAPRLNVGVAVCADSNGHMTTDSVSTALLTRIAEKSDNQLQLFMIRNDSRSGGTVGPMLSSVMGVRAIDAGIPQLSMHSIRATTGSLDPGLGVKMFTGFFDHFEEVDKEFK